MGLLRVVAVVLLVGLLGTTLLAGNAVVVAERTVLSAPFVTETLEGTDAYGTAREVAIEEAEGTVPALEDGEAGGGPPAVFGNASERILEEAVTEAYLQSEVERNVRATYAYLHGDRDTLVVAVDVEPVRERALAILEAEIRNASLAELFAAVGAEDAGIPLGGATLSLATIGEMGESPAAYAAARADVRDRVTAAVVEQLVEETYAAASDDERLALVIEDYDPTAYTDAEKRSMVEARESEIRAAIQARVLAESGDEVSATVDARLAELADRDWSTAATEALGEDAPPGMAEPVGDIVDVSVEALATDMPYPTYRAQVDAAKADLAAAATDELAAQLAAEGEDELVLLDSTEPGSAEGLAEARRAVGIVDRLAIGLPLLALGLLGGLWWLTRSAVVTAGGAGVGLLVAGVPGVVGARLAAEQVGTAIQGVGIPPALSGLAVAVLDRVLGVLAVQSATLAVAGALLVAAAAYLHVSGTPAWAVRG